MLDGGDGGDGGGGGGGGGGGVGVPVRTADPTGISTDDVSVAVIFEGPTVVVVIVAVYVPSPLGVTGLNWGPLGLAEKTIVSAATSLPLVPVTVAVAVLVEVPFATIELGESCSLRLEAGEAAGEGAASRYQLSTVASAPTM